MRSQEPISSFDRLIDEAIGQDLEMQPNYFLVQKVMSNIYSISNNSNVIEVAEPFIRLRMAVVYGFSIAASIITGYLIGDMSITNTASNMMLVNFENINMTNLLAI
jgi:hypothetical protein